MKYGTNVWAAVALAIALTSCAGDAGSPHAGALSVAPSGRTYRVWYLAPPWVQVSLTGEHAVLNIPTIPNPNAPRTLAGALTALNVDVVAGAPATLLAARVAAGLADTTRDDHLVYAPRAVTLAQGVSGLEASWAGPLHTMRVAVARLPDGRTIVLTFESLLSIENDADVTDMIAQVETVTVGP